MCAAPSIGAFLGPALTPFFTAIGSDPSVAACMVLGVDSGGLPLALALAKTHEAAMLSGLGLGGSFGCIMTFALPISLSICSEESRPDVARGLVAGIIAAPFSLFTVAAVMGYGFGDVLRLGLPAFAVAAILALLLTFCRDAAVRGCLLVGRLMMAAFVVLLASAAIEHWFSVTLIPGMAPIGRQLEIVGEIGVMLSGAFPMVKFAERHFGGAIRGLARLLRIDSTASLGMIVSIANPLPMYVTLNRMTPEGRVVCSAFSGPVLCLLGDHLGFITAAYPAGTIPMLAGKILSAVLALMIALLLVRAGRGKQAAAKMA
jgi:ethanolamine transporter